MWYGRRQSVRRSRGVVRLRIRGGDGLKPEPGPNPPRARAAERATRVDALAATKRAERRWPRTTAKRAEPPPTRFLAAAAQHDAEQGAQRPRRLRADPCCSGLRSHSIKRKHKKKRNDDARRTKGGWVGDKNNMRRRKAIFPRL